MNIEWRYSTIWALCIGNGNSRFPFSHGNPTEMEMRMDMV